MMRFRILWLAALAVGAGAVPASGRALASVGEWGSGGVRAASGGRGVVAYVATGGPRAARGGRASAACSAACTRSPRIRLAGERTPSRGVHGKVSAGPAAAAPAGSPPLQLSRRAAAAPAGSPPLRLSSRRAAAQAPSLVGTFLWDSAASDDVRKAIDGGTHHMSFITKPFARKRLRATNVPYRRIVIGRDSAHVSLQTDQRAPIVAPEDGTPIEWTREDGEVLQVRARWQADTLTMSFQAGDGVRENRYTLDPDGRTVHMHVTITSPRLPGPVEYTLTYRRS